MRETKHLAVILKKQPLNEADELVTLYAQDLGKVRALAKSIKSSKSKLQQKLQALFLVEVTLTQGGLKKIIGVEVVDTYPVLRENLNAVAQAFFAVELVLKFTADEQKNLKLFSALTDFLRLLNSTHNDSQLNLGLLKFKQTALAALGLAVRCLQECRGGQRVFFSCPAGGFCLQNGRPVEAEVVDLFLAMEGSTFSQIDQLSAINASAQTLQELLSEFIEFQLERQLKSEKLIKVL